MVSLTVDTPELAKIYDIRGQRQYSHGRLLIADLAVHPGHRVLDIGTGTGLLAAHVADLVGPSGSVVGIDPLPLRIEIARAKARPNLTFQVGQAEDLRAFAEKSFDIVYLNSVFHWLPDQHRALTEILRVLNPGGRVGFSCASQEKPHSIQLARQRALASLGIGSDAQVVHAIHHRLSVAEVEQLFRRTGLRTLEINIRTFVDFDQNVDDILAFSLSSSFGNDLLSLPEQERPRFREALARELDSSREVRGIRQERNLVFAVAERPRS